ncbi:peptidylprolyl isomerase [Psychroserpens luteolus]|uniref:peptidylprolyl isomerase n=1 Tax=Psychroserpens luteolus TaxID=2855840 RepID=UPI001E42B99A|nr:peptidylprolyl isomerase [Psychroserpens luteolus]MCD2260579.1 peptidylprolyl isomerase [Psychroserpens luteolus]
MKLFVTSILLCFSLGLQAQVKDKDVLFTVEGEPVMASEFIRVYNKNLDLVKDESQKDIDAYLELFVNYQLKVKEARRLELDKDPNYLREFNNYKKQLTKNFMADNKVTDALVEEAYHRTTNDVKVSHILVRLDETETDTTAVYNQLLELRERVAKEGYAAVQKAVHNGKTIFAEDLGYFGGFKMVYPFETVAFNTPKGEISMPFRTRFGYHILKVFDKRKSLGEVTVAHIMISNKQNDSTVVPETRINQIYKKIQQGEKFESLARQFSNDKSSAKKGGALAPFTGGQLSSKEFEDVAFSLENQGDISAPFKTAYGWHIMKLIRKKGIQPFEEVKVQLQNKVKRDSRSKLINSALVKKLATKYKVEENKKGLNYFESIITDAYFKQAWKTPEGFDADNTLIKIGDVSVSNKAFSDHLMSNQRKYNNRRANPKALIETEYNAFYEAQVLKYHEDNLEFENEDFAFVLKEYRDGLLLFDLMEKEVWNRATKDSVGLKAFFEKNKTNYTWKDRVDAVILSSASERKIDQLREALLNGADIDEMYSKLVTEKSSTLITTQDVFEEGHASLPKDFEFNKGTSKIYNHNDSYHVIYVKEVFPSGHKTLDEARGKVVSDYQAYIEDNWVDTLSKRFKVKLNDSVLKRVKKQILKK